MRIESLFSAAAPALFFGLIVAVRGAIPNPTETPFGQPAPASVATPRDPHLPSLFIAGDSTAARNSGHPIQGWGEPFAAFFDPAKINVVNVARGGRSSRTFITEGWWDRVVANLKPGDFVLIQFGHNDPGAINAEPPGSKMPLRARGSLPGLGEESTEIDNVLTHRHEVVHTFGWYLRKMIADTKAKGATPIVLSPTVRNIWHDGKVERNLGEYRNWSRAVAEAEHVSFVDLTRIVADKYQALGEAKVGALFPRDHTHTNPTGAQINAEAVVAGLKGLRGVVPDTVFSAAGAAVPSDFMTWLNLREPANPALPTLLLIGDSTVRNGRGDGAGGQWGWGAALRQDFDPAKINVVNRAVGGTSSRSFSDLGYWSRARPLLKRGDFLLIQFGHNDGSRADRMTLPGTGEGTKPASEPGAEPVHTYGWYLRRYVRDAKTLGVTPIVCSPIPRKIWRDGEVVRSTPDGYAAWAREVAQQEGVVFIDLNDLIATRYEALGPAKVDPLFADEHTHTTWDGAVLNAGIVLQALRALPGAPLRSFEAAGVKP